jgi:hypothetical protein
MADHEAASLTGIASKRERALLILPDLEYPVIIVFHVTIFL